jgi:hypothetical protein
VNAATEPNGVNNEWFYHIMKSANKSIINNDIKMVIGDLIRNNNMRKYIEKVVGKPSLHN